MKQILVIALLGIASTATADGLRDADGRVREDARYYKEPPYLSAPADPWAAVAGDQPARWSKEQSQKWTLRGNESPCTAKEDHCLVKDAWFFIRPDEVERKATTSPLARIGAAVGVFGDTGKILAPWNARSRVTAEHKQAFRTVPATAKTLVPGASVIAIEFAYTQPPHSGIGAFEAGWEYGKVESVDLEAGTFKLEGYSPTFPVTHARVIVLAWREGGKVEIVGGKKKSELAVKVKDVFVPVAREPAAPR